MERIKSLRCCVLAAIAMTLAACGNDGVQEGKTFDAAFVAAEADKGNFVPLKEISKACHGEVLKYGKRRAACETFDQVGKLRKPLAARF